MGRIPGGSMNLKLKLSLKSLIVFPLFFFLGVALTHCTSLQKKDFPPTAKITPVSNLTQVEAQARAKLILNPRYTLKFEFDSISTSYQASADIRFKMATVHSTFLDFKGGEIQSYSINGKIIPVKYENYRIYLAKEDLLVGENKVSIVYKQNFSKNGRGIYRFQDSEDNKIYIWTKLEPFDANQVFPCFDQPDLKAVISSQITAPSDWKVVFTTLETQKSVTGTKTQWVFPESPIMSTYLFSIHAGHYEVWSDHYKTIPLRLFVRASLKKYVDVPFWFSITKKGFRFFEKEFAFSYPFKKYDQLIVPEFSAGGMENIAAVNYNERFVLRGIASRDEKEKLANILLHEMAHMWFGDLVTMNWWDELWLNESFATFMAYNASEKATEFKEAWANFQKRGKLAAYIEDQYPTTHPISTEVADINATFNHFDAITYSKGAAVLRQLSYYIGEDNFRKGVQGYFREHAYTNTTLIQFIAALEKSSKIDLQTWSALWLRTAGLDTIKVTPTCENDKLTQLKFDLIPPTGNDIPRPHRIPMTLYKWTGNKLKTWVMEDWVVQDFSESRTITTSLPCPDLILPNATDMTYIKTAMDTNQIRWAQTHLNEIASPLARGVFWNQAYLNLRDGTLKMEDFIQMFSAQFKKEKNQIIIQQFFEYWSALAAYLPQKTDLQLAVRLKALETVERHFWNEISSTSDLEWKKTLLVNWARRLETEESQTRVVEILKNPLSLKPFIIDQDVRWLLIQRLAALDHPQTNELIAEARIKDPSETGFKAYLSADAARVTSKNKSKWLEEMNRPNTNWSLARKQSILYSLFPKTPKQNQLRDEYRQQFYKTMSLLNKKNEDISYNRSYTELAPASCENETIKEFDDYIASQKWHVVIKRSLVIQNQENKICARIRAR